MRNTVNAAVLSVFVVCMLLTNVPLAFADSSSSSVIDSPDNGISGDYVSVDLYLKDGDDYLPATSNVFSEGSVGCIAKTTGSVTVYSFSATSVTLSKSNLYVMVTSKDPDARYTLVSTVTESGTFNVTGSTYTVLYSGSTSVTAVPGTYYAVSLTMNVLQYASSAMPVMPTLSVTVSAVDSVTSVIMDTTNTVEAEVVAHYQTADSAAEDMIDKNDAGEDGSITGNDGETYYIRPGNEDDSTTSVYISDSDDGNRISNPAVFFGSDPFDASVTIPAGQSFVVAVTLNHAWLASANITVSLTIGNTTMSSGSLTSTGTTYVFHSTGSSLSTSKNLNSVSWMQYTGNVTIGLSGSANSLLGSASVTVEIVFQK